MEHTRSNQTEIPPTLPAPRTLRALGVPTLRRLSPDRPLLEGEAQVEVARRDRLERRLLVVADAFAGFGALGIVALLAGGTLPSAALLAYLPVLLVTAKLLGLYDRDELVVRKTSLDESPQLFQLATFLTLLFALTPTSLVGDNLHRDQVLVLWPSLLALLLCLRTISRGVASRILAEERCLVVGDGEAAYMLAGELELRGQGAAEVVGIVSLSRGFDRALSETMRAITQKRVHRVIIAPRTTDSEDVLDVIKAVKGLGVKVSLLPRMLEVVGSSVVFDDVGGVKLLGIRRFGLSRSSRVIKRALDVVGAAVALLAVGPLLLTIALLIRRDSPGPVLFRQTRVGRDGERFEMLKFRTMVNNAEALKRELLELNEADGLFKIAEDPRITRVGRVLRRTSLDELPQLLNVLRGDMSLVGPRPLVVDEDELVQGLARRRLHLTPGMTGHWQILGSARIPLHEMVKIDYLYVANWSLWTDLKIMLRTVPYMLRRGGL
jgi:exopolysaccharide biosynthesis polyprenyl glycosylphosphotransferase